MTVQITGKEGWQPWVIKEINLYGEEGGAGAKKLALEG